MQSGRFQKKINELASPWFPRNYNTIAGGKLWTLEVFWKIEQALCWNNRLPAARRITEFPLFKQSDAHSPSRGPRITIIRMIPTGDRGRGKENHKASGPFHFPGIFSQTGSSSAATILRRRQCWYPFFRKAQAVDHGGSKAGGAGGAARFFRFSRSKTAAFSLNARKLPIRAFFQIGRKAVASREAVCRSSTFGSRIFRVSYFF